MAKFLASTQVNMYPTAHRGTNIDVASFLNTEENLTTTKELSEVPQFNNYSYNNGDNLVVFIQGYKFIIDDLYTMSGNTINFNPTTFENIQPDSGDELYAFIKLENNATYGDIIIPNFDNSLNDNALDYYNGTIYVFYGLSFGAVSEASSPNLAILIGKKVDNVWTPVFQRHKLASYEISNGITDVDSDPISKTFNTQTINVQDINLTGDIQKGNQSVIIPPYTTSKVNYVLSVEEVTINGQQVAKLVWREYYNDSLSTVS